MQIKLGMNLYILYLRLENRRNGRMISIGRCMGGISTCPPSYTLAYNLLYYVLILMEEEIFYTYLMKEQFCKIDSL